MKKLWVFGDSFSIPFSSDFPWCQEYCKFKGYVPKTYGEIIAQKLNLELHNHSVGGCDNNTIIEKFTNNCLDINPRDIVIVGWTSPYRFRLYSEKIDTWQIVSPTPTPLHLNFEMISKQTIEEILVNRGNQIYVEELNNWEKLLSFSLIGTNHFFWRWSEMMGRKQIQSIYEETNGLIQDSHYSENGHAIISEIAIEYLNLNNKLT